MSATAQGIESLPILITLATTAFSGGVFVGMFTARFVQKRECEKHRDQLWERIDSMQNCMTGGRVKFELKMVTDNDRGN